MTQSVNRYEVWDQGFFVGYLHLTLDGVRRLERLGFRLKMAEVQ